MEALELYSGRLLDSHVWALILSIIPAHSAALSLTELRASPVCVVIEGRDVLRPNRI